MDTRVGRFTGRPRFMAWLVALFAGCALSLAAAGLYGVLSFLVCQQTQEIGVRMAMGVRPRDIGMRIQRQAASWVVAGVIAGTAGSLAATRLVRGLLFELAPEDPASLTTAVVVLAGVAPFAAWAPARKAARVDPIVALRHD